MTTIDKGLAEIAARQAREQLASCEAALERRDAEVMDIKGKVERLEAEGKRLRETVAAYQRRYRLDYEQLLALWGELWRQAEARGDTSPGLSFEVLDRGHAEVAKIAKERDEAQANYQWMVNKACDERLDGYRELGARAAAAENERDSAKAELAKVKADATAIEEAFYRQVEELKDMRNWREEALRLRRQLAAVERQLADGPKGHAEAAIRRAIDQAGEEPKP